MERAGWTGLFTDSDLARLFEHRREETLDQPIKAVMTARPLTVLAGERMADGRGLMARRKISECRLSTACAPGGLIDVTDVVALSRSWTTWPSRRGARRCSAAPAVRPPAERLTREIRERNRP